MSDHTPGLYEVFHWKEQDELLVGIPDADVGWPSGYSFAKFSLWGGDEDATAWANATHIVNCVNAHDELVEALGELLEFVDRGPIEEPLPGNFADARTALAKARGDHTGEDS